MQEAVVGAGHMDEENMHNQESPRNGRVAVVGGGPAGLSAALAASSAGAPCVLFERGRIGEEIRCAEGVFDPAGLVPLPKSVIRTRVRRVALRVGAETFVFSISRRARFFVIDRAEWQSGEGAKARAAGVEIREREAADPAALLKDFQWVVDARGRSAFSLGGEPWPQPSAFGLQWTLEGDFTPWKDSLEVEVAGPPPGYFWIFPKGEREANVGFGWLEAGEPRADAWGELEGFIRRRGLSGCRKTARAGGFMPASNRAPRSECGVFRVGDAGGFGSPLHGGGIDAAWFTGRLAVETALRGEGGDRFFSRLNAELGALRGVEKRVLERWRESGPAVLSRAARTLARAAPFLRVSTRLLFVPGVRAAVWAAFSGRPPSGYYGP